MSCQDVCIDVDYDGGTEFANETIRRAAKLHKCCECGVEIATGERYEYVSAKSDGDFWTAKTCLVCVEIRKAFCCYGYIVGNLWEDVREQIFPEWDEMKAIDCLAKLSSDAAVAKMRARYKQYREGTDV